MCMHPVQAVFMDVFNLLKLELGCEPPCGCLKPNLSFVSETSDHKQ